MQGHERAERDHGQCGQASPAFTPGRWKEGPKGIIAAIREVSGGGRETRFVAQVVQCMPLIEGEQEANARLIAASPTMLAALKTIGGLLSERFQKSNRPLARDDELWAAYSSVIAAIAKATMTAQQPEHAAPSRDPDKATGAQS